MLNRLINRGIRGIKDVRAYNVASLSSSSSLVLNSNNSNQKLSFSTSNQEKYNNHGYGGNKVLFNDERFYSEEKYQGISKEPFSKEITDVLLANIGSEDIEIKPDGLIYLPEIKYRRILNTAFGPGGWALKPFGPPVVDNGSLIRPYALYCLGRYVAESIGEQPYNESSSFISFATATEAAKSNALVRCCKDLGIGSSLWDPTFIRQWKAQYATEKFFENQKSKEKRKFWILKNGVPNQISYPWKEIDYTSVPSQDSFTPSFVNTPQQETIYTQDSEPTTTAKSASTSASTATTTTNQSGATIENGSEETTIDIDDIVPPQMKKYAGKTWREVIGDPKGLQYLEWVVSKFDSNSEVRLLAQAMLDFARNNS
ncbi:hypothetical protein CYY_005650 [Polysphondylium violaceum]|uniref:Mitochondrial genome maintenance protein n=1 Tax=Polysphondylium violaceum TaxID=133409 RepID=A0A8J4V6N2_9MYCE|nr:hypothetical protein CYY_005650 [Polysphondylium violaceum]